MDSTHWLRYFQDNRLNRPEPHWDLPCAEDAGTHAAWLDHRPALTAVGADRREFLRQACRECQAFLRASKPARGPGRLRTLI